MLSLKWSLQLDMCIAEMTRKGFSIECPHKHAQRWLEVVAAVCGADSFSDPSARAPSREVDPDWIPKPTRSGKCDGACEQKAQPLASSRCLRFAALLQQHQPSMVDRLGKNISATTLNSFDEV